MKSSTDNSKRISLRDMTGMEAALVQMAVLRMVEEVVNEQHQRILRRVGMEIDKQLKNIEL